MSKLTLLKIVNNTLMAMEATQVSTIDETLESTSIARIAEEVFYEMVSQGDWPHLTTVFPMLSVADSSRPNYLSIPEDIKEIKSLRYNGQQLIYKTLEEFLNISNTRDINSDTVVQVTDFNGTKFSITNNSAPMFFTVLNDKYIITDSYDEDDTATLIGDNCTAVCTKIPAWTEDDSFIPELTENMFPTYLALVKRASFMYLRRESSPKDERAATAGMGRLYRQESKLNLGKEIKNYGR